MRSSFAVCFLTIATANADSAINPPSLRHDEPGNCRQLLVVTSNSWPAQTGRMKMFERVNNAPWRQFGSTIDVRLGRNGLAWGRGVIDTTKLAGPIKKEGDDKAPAGIFRLGNVFGWKKQTKMPFIGLTPHIICVDDPSSRYYNRIVDQTKIDNRDWKHAENLFGVEAYRLGIVVEHNIPPQPSAGSCIFLHVWKSPNTATSGCTAMSEQDLIRVIHRLDPAKQPLLVQLPRSVYQSLCSPWALPCGVGQ
jgi:zinc D-Ala-D-Ala dipeptidase